MNVIFNHFRNYNNVFKDMKPRTKQFLIDSMWNPDSIEMIEMKLLIMNKVFYQMKIKITQATNDYF